MAQLVLAVAVVLVCFGLARALAEFPPDRSAPAPEPRCRFISELVFGGPMSAIVFRAGCITAAWLLFDAISCVRRDVHLCSSTTSTAIALLLLLVGTVDMPRSQDRASPSTTLRSYAHVSIASALIGAVGAHLVVVEMESTGSPSWITGLTSFVLMGFVLELLVSLRANGLSWYRYDHVCRYLTNRSCITDRTCRAEWLAVSGLLFLALMQGVEALRNGHAPW